MNLKKSPEIQENEWVLSLIKTFIYCIYKENWDINSQNIIKIKNKLAIEMASLYDKMIKDYQKWNLSKTFILNFNDLILEQFAQILVNFKKDSLRQLFEINQWKAQNEEQKNEIKKYIETHIDKILQISKNEIDIIIEQFNKKCIEILIDSSNVSKKLLSASHERSLSRINKLTQETQELVIQISSLQTTNTSLSSQVELLNSQKIWLEKNLLEKELTIQEQSQRLVKIFRNWKSLNIKVWELERDKMQLLETLSEIDIELAKKWEQEIIWREWIKKFQRFDEIETKLKEEIIRLENQLSNAKDQITELSNQLNQSKTLISAEEWEIKELIKTTITDYFYFVIQSDGFINQQKLTTYQNNIKQVYYRSKMMDFDVNNFIFDFIKTLILNHENNPKHSTENINLWYKELINFLNELIYWKNYVTTAQKAYEEVYTM